MLTENKDNEYKRLIPYIEGMIPIYVDATLAKQEVADKSIVYQLLSSIPERISVSKIKREGEE